jgi:hypothetical protein
MEAAEIDKELEDLDTRIDQLRALYEQYFMGIERIEPQKPRQDIERKLKVLRKEQIRNTAQRFKFNVLVQRMNTMAQYWGRVVREMENGTFKRDVIRAAARFGETALTGLGKKRAAELAKVAVGQGKRPADDTYELGADDLVEDWGDELQEEEDEAPTPPKMEVPAQRSYPVAAYPVAAQPYIAVPPPQSPYGTPAPYPAQYAAPAAPPSNRGLGPADLPVIQADAGPPSRPGALPPPNPPSRSGLRWGSSDPSSSIRQAPIDPKRRVAELAAELRGQRPPDEGSGFGALDLDFEDGPAAPRPAAAAGLPRAVPPPAAPSGVRAVGPQAPVARPAGGFGVLDVSLDEAPSPLAPAPSPSSPGSGIRAGAANRPLPQPTLPRAPAVTAAPPARPQPAPAAPPTGGDPGDQRFRQIYAKYVETKRSANESTAGVTYEKLAATLRAQTEKLRAQHPSKAVDFDVVIKDGKTHLKPVLK